MRASVLHFSRASWWCTYQLCSKCIELDKEKRGVQRPPLGYNPWFAKLAPCKSVLSQPCLGKAVYKQKWQHWAVRECSHSGSYILLCFYIFSSAIIQKTWVVLRAGMRSQGRSSLGWWSPAAQSWVCPPHLLNIWSQHEVSTKLFSSNTMNLFEFCSKSHSECMYPFKEISPLKKVNWLGCKIQLGKFPVSDLHVHLLLEQTSLPCASQGSVRRCCTLQEVQGSASSGCLNWGTERQVHLLTRQHPDVQPGQMCHCSLLPTHLISFLHPQAGAHPGHALVLGWDRARNCLVHQLRHGLIYQHFVCYTVF